MNIISVGIADEQECFVLAGSEGRLPDSLCDRRLVFTNIMQLACCLMIEFASCSVF
jgi:hypothetical protein